MSQPIAEADPNNAQLKSMFRSIHFSTDAATELVTVKVINSVEEIKTLTQYCVTCLCSIIRKPGGETNIHVVSDPAENIFHLLVYCFQH